MAYAYDVFLDMKRGGVLSGETSEAQVKEGGHLLSSIKHRVLSDAPNALVRQTAGVLFAYAQEALETYALLEKPKVWREASNEKKRYAGSLLFLIAGVLSVLLFWQLREKNEVLLSWFVAAQAILCGAGVFHTLKMQKEQPIRVTCRYDGDKLLDFIGEWMRMIDRDLEAVTALMEGEHTEAIPDDTFEIIRKCFELECRKEPVHPELQQAVQTVLLRNGIEAVTYSPDCEALFEVMPTLGTEKTVIPALLREGKLISRGFAVTREEML